MKPINEYTLQECLDAMKRIDADLLEYGYHEALSDRIHSLTRWIPVSERLPTEEDVMNTNDDIHSYMNGLVLWLVAHESGRLDYVLSKWYMPPSTYNKLLAWRRIDKPEGK
jgi:hypothetical protein